jgi:hypothetical protein
MSSKTVADAVAALRGGEDARVIAAAPRSCRS